MDTTSSSPRKLSGLAIAALVVALVGVCVPCVGPLSAAILAVVALVKLKGAQRGGAAFAIVALVLAGLVALMQIGLAAAVAVPSYVAFQSKAKQSECRTQLLALQTAQEAFFAEHSRYSEDPAELGFFPAAGHQYTYALSEDRSRWLVGQADPPGPRVFDEAIRLGVSGTCPDCSWAAACIGDVDGDLDADVWILSSAGIVLATGLVIAAGVLHNLEPDLTVGGSTSTRDFDSGGARSYDDDD